MGLQNFLPALGRFQRLDRGNQLLLNVLNLITTSCQRRLEAFPQLRSGTFRSPQGGLVARRLFFQPFITFGDQGGECGQRGGMFVGQAIYGVLQLAASVCEDAIGFAQVGTEPLHTCVCRRAGLLEALTLVLRFRQATSVFESLAGQSRFKVCLALECLRAEAVASSGTRTA